MSLSLLNFDSFCFRSLSSHFSLFSDKRAKTTHENQSQFVRHRVNVVKIAKMSGAVLKYISWYIDIPSIEDCKDDDEKSQVISTQFTMDQSVVDSCWFLKVHFNCKKAAEVIKQNLMSNLFIILDQKSGKLAVFLCSPEGLSFCLKFTATILNQTTFTENKSATRATVYDDPDEPDMNGFVVSDLITLDELHNDDIGFEQDGKIHLVVVIRDTEWKIEDEGVDDESNTGNDLFTLMTRTDPSEIVTLRSSDGKEFNAYKSILTNKASILNLNARLQESPGIIEMEFKGAIVQEFLRYLSIGEVHTMDVVDSELYEMAKVYKVEELCKMCLSSIESRLCKENVIEYLKFSDKHELEDLFDACCTVLAW